MKVCVCLYGLCGGKNDKTMDITYTSYTKALRNLDQYVGDYDTFFHTWDYDSLNEKQLISDFRPICHHIEQRKKFDDDNKWNMTLSRWYSHSESIKLKAAYEQKMEFTYDYVLLMRFDCIFYVPIDFSIFTSAYMYASHWPDGIKTGLLDYWFISDSKTMNVFGQIYNNMSQYRNKYSEEVVKSNHTVSYLHLELNKIPLKHIFYEYKEFCLEKRLNDRQMRNHLK